MSLGSYCKCLIANIPGYIYFLLLGLFLVGASCFFIWKGRKMGAIYTSRLFLFNFLFFIYCSTVFFRNSNDDYKYNYHIFWSYGAWQRVYVHLLSENIMNFVVFIPVGMFLGLGYPKWLLWKVVGLGCLCSISIEVLQLVFMKGFSETDDVIHNTLGCLFGYLLLKVVVKSENAIVNEINR